MSKGKMVDKGYRKPLDRPELEKEIEKLVSKAYWYEGKKNIVADITDQILAIIPKDKPPLLSAKQLEAIAGTIEDAPPSPIRCVTMRKVAQAQREADIKWYEGDYERGCQVNQGISLGR